MIFKVADTTFAREFQVKCADTIAGLIHRQKHSGKRTPAFLGLSFGADSAIHGTASTLGRRQHSLGGGNTPRRSRLRRLGRIVSSTTASMKRIPANCSACAQLMRQTP
jgi:hypothetical protein